ncbi:MAG TPA: hypothetical protein VFI24_06740 [Pyrinomonadaceae bacterium]|nr:hypothetical protein [Pyrinomonadaceae bacterium]
MTYKVGEGPNSNPEFTGSTSHSTAKSQSGQEHSATTANTSYSHDNTPLRQRELETFGNNTRSRVEGYSPGNSEFGHSHNPKSAGNVTPPPLSEGGLGLSLSGELAGVDVQANVRLGNTTDGGRSVQINTGNDIQVDYRNAPEGPSLANNSRDNTQSVSFRNESAVRPEFRNTPESVRFERSNDSAPRIANSSSDRSPSLSFRTESDVRFDPRNNAPESFQSNRLNNGSSDLNHLLRDTIKDLRGELNALRHDFHGNGHGHGRADYPPLGLNERHVDHLLNIATRGIEDRLGRGDAPERIARQLRADIAGVTKFSEHFSRLESVGGEPVRRAYESILRLALHTSEHESNRLPFIAEVLRDLRNGAFLHLRDVEGPFPLTGRARIVSEMMELMRTLEAIDKFTAEMKAAPYGKYNADLSLFSLGRVPGVVDVELAEALAKAFANLGPTLPSMAGRVEILRLVAALNGMLSDSTGRPLITMDGLPLKLGELLWFNARPEAFFDLWSGDRFSTRLFPSLLHGFDAVYSLMGFDGRSLSLPHFIAIQSQMNASEFEWFFGHAPLSEGWLRSVIEFLKDSISFDHNVLGETLEEALTNSRFHVAVMRGTVEDGRAVAGSFTFEPIPAR